MRKATERISFTKKSLEKIPVPAAGRVHVYDDTTRGLGLRVDVSGRKSFFWFRKVAGRPEFRVVGTFPECSIESARGKAEELSGALDKLKRNDFEGKNPFVSRDGEPTVKALIEDYCERHLGSHSKKPEKAKKDARWLRDHYLTPLNERRIGSVRKKEVVDLHGSIGSDHGKYAANRTIQLLRAAYFFAERHEIWSGVNPARGIELFPEKKRRRFLDKNELASLFQSLSASPNRNLRDFVWLGLATGARKSDVLSMRWQDIRDKTWHVPDMTKEEAYEIALVPEALAVLRARKAITGDSPFVFPGDGATGHAVDLKNAWKKVLVSAGLWDADSQIRVHQHDLRRTLGSIQAQMGFSEIVIGKSLGHAVGSSATAIYARLNLQSVRPSVTKATKKIFRSAKSKSKPRLRLKA